MQFLAAHIGAMGYMRYIIEIRGLHGPGARDGRLVGPARPIWAGKFSV